jgi:DNA-binding PadR family transcriptional regulator
LTALPSGTVHPILARLEAIRWLESSWEDVDSTVVGRPRRRYYRLSDEGIVAALRALAAAQAARASLVRLRPAEA